MNVQQTTGTAPSWKRLAGRVAAGAVTAVLAVGIAAIPAGAATSPAATSAASVSAVSAVSAVSTVSAAGHVTVKPRSYYFGAVLLGRNEVREPGKKVNDRDGVAVAKFRIQGNRMFYLVQWKRTGRPTAFHVHRGKAGVNGPVVIDLLHDGTIRGNSAFGSVRVKDLSVLAGIKKNPGNWYANMHTKQFADGAVRGQLLKTGRW
ncbi:CHRD domain-containing protein [Sphaerisporangium sp. NPDC005288]|uniref:CHRD domain-containing protein n=1 Tax=Sphaerisporangium sp. NPDC005288 TaxID=3155114 RepID=UPI0033B2EA43